MISTRCPPPTRQLIDYVEGPNEGDSTPARARLAEAHWFNRFWVALTRW